MSHVETTTKSGFIYHSSDSREEYQSDEYTMLQREIADIIGEQFTLQKKLQWCEKKLIEARQKLKEFKERGF